MTLEERELLKITASSLLKLEKEILSRELRLSAYSSVGAAPAVVHRFPRKVRRD
jgi:hypothetical protein